MNFSDLFPFQRADVQFLLERPKELNGKPHRLLANDMGTGKTPCCCVAITESRMSDKPIHNALIICPHPVKETWARQLIDWGVCTREQIQIVEAGYDYIQPVTKKPFVIINYELCISELIEKQLLRKSWHLCVVDEAQRLKSLSSKRSNKILGGNDSIIARAYYKWLLSGTIAPNRPVELYPMLKTLAPEIIKPYVSWDAFGQRYCDAQPVKGIPGALEFKGASNVEELAERLKPFMRRRRLKDVYKDLPPVVGTSVYIDIGDLTCDETNTPTGTLRRLVGETKVPFVIDYLTDRLANQRHEKIVVFVYHRSVAEKLQAHFGNVCQLVYGGMAKVHSDAAIAAFQKQPVKLLIAQINVLGEGIDGLQQICNNAVFAELDWSTSGIDQPIGRLQRIGQTRPVNVALLIAEGTLDDAMYGTYWSKKRVLNVLLETNTFEVNEMSLEDQVKRVGDLLEKLVNHMVIVPKQDAAQAQVQVDVEAEKPKGKGGRPPKQHPAPEPQAEVKTNGNGHSDLTLEAVQDLARQALNAHGGEEDARTKLKAVIAGCGLDTLKNAKEPHFVALAAGFKKLIASAEESDDLGV